MFVKELHVKQPITKEIEVLKDIEAEDSFDFKGFILVKLLVPTEDPGKDTVFYFNRNLITKIVPHSLDWDPPGVVGEKNA